MSADRNVSTSPSLLIRIRDPSDSEAWDQFVEIYSSIVRDYCFQRRLQKSDIDDLVQEVMAIVCKSIRTFEYDPTKGRFRGWLGTIAANKIKSFLAKTSRRNGKSVEFNGHSKIANLANGFADPDSDWVAIFSERIFKTACSRIRHQINETAWECFESSWMKKMSSAEIAESLGIALHLVYVNKSRVIKRLEAEIRLLAEDAPITRGDYRQ